MSDIFFEKMLSVARVDVDTHVDDMRVPINRESSENCTIALQSALSPFFSIWVQALQERLQQSVIVVFPNDEQAHIADTIIQNINRSHHKDSFERATHSIHVPSWGAVAGSGIAQYAPIRSERASVLSTMALDPPNILYCSIALWNQFLPSKTHFQQTIIKIMKGDDFDPSLIVETLVQWHYTRVPQVRNEGEFAIRGEVLDIFVSKNTNGMGINQAVRISLDFGIIESIKLFDIESQISTTAIAYLIIHPRSEFVWNEKNIQQLEKNIDDIFPEVSSTVIRKTKDILYTQWYDEYDYLYGAFAYPSRMHIIDFFDDTPYVLFANYEMIIKQAEYYWNTQKEIFLSQSNVQCIPRYSRIKQMLDDTLSHITPIPIYRNTTTQNLISIGDRETQKFTGNLSYFFQYASQKQKEGTEICIACDTHNHKERIELLLRGSQSAMVLEDDMIEENADENADEHNDETGGKTKTASKKTAVSMPYTIIIGEYGQGFLLPHAKIELYTEVDLLGRKLHHFDEKNTKAIESIQQIEQDDIVVHIQYGIGKFIALTRMAFAGIEKDFLQIMYAGDEMLYVPVEQMNMVQRYIGQTKEKVVLDAIGGQGWTKRKKKALKKIEDLSGELLETHAKRNMASGFQFEEGMEWEEVFINAFPFEETDDQVRVWEEISQDMKKPRPMDRLVVGDVGFGKTELAFRAAFRAISAGKQVAFLVPTTILAEQHYYSAIDRFNTFPISIAMLSRFVSPKEQKKTIAEILKGTVELIIGTHRILQKDIIYKDLGLYIIDEEHRFGVKDKEYIKHHRDAIDCLSLSATPIPRTLYQSIVQLRDMSMLMTAPKKRKPIKTFVEKFDEGMVSKAIVKELERGGQVFYLHNRVASLDEVQSFIEYLVPQASVVTASGQMSPKDLEDTMYRFINKGANVLVSTTIIENGIDIPNVNTIIIDRADNYGISQLYQLRGRVGRSDRVAYAYLLYPDSYAISDIALKRLSTISDNSELGAGFQIAMRDLEVRGSGNLLGKEQSGSIFAIGYEHYITLLDDAMKKIKGIPNPPEPVLELSYTGFIPNSYIDDSIIKMEVYKQIISIKNMESYEEVFANIENKYGHIPAEVSNLFWIAKVKMLCITLHIYHLKETNLAFELHCANMASLSTKNITTLLQAGSIALNPKNSNVLYIPLSKKARTTLEEKYHILHDCLMNIMEETL